MKMIENVDSVVTRSSQDLWAEICSCLPDPDQKDDFSDTFTDSFTDSYITGESQDEEPGGSFQANLKPWAPLKDSEIYLASLACVQNCKVSQSLQPKGLETCLKNDNLESGAQDDSLQKEILACYATTSWPNLTPSYDTLLCQNYKRRLMRIKGLSQEVTSKDMLHTLAQAKKECWDRFLQEKFESEFYVEGHESEESTLEHLKRWLQPDKVAISTEEVQYLIPPESHIEKQETGEESPAAEQ
ncbi:coiled-coil domain-containing protein 32 isoform X2 [Malaclemys terrapin pileata]|nr:coiled-coil domain-containing protein 32 isoform X2 [Malaclemys terrapin pileata]XP_053884165.1 coiled-coil domain-containing protein 32 isoform X2 [Malaclemys terrapin pileata]XP_053884166.1 coiled-coil domain-containing protein 32 isoform X2 [Malaclemys terrapin pileata]